MKMNEIFNDIWNDPVWSKVIGGLILAIIIYLSNLVFKKIFKKSPFHSDEELIIKTLNTTQFPNGITISGLITDTGLERDIINKSLDKLKRKGIVKFKRGRKELWKLTIKGRMRK